jgi:hypothetical protein
MHTGRPTTRNARVKESERHKQHLAAKRRHKNKRPRPADQAEPTHLWGRGRERAVLLKHNIKRMMKFEERDHTPIELIAFEPAGPECERRIIRSASASTIDLSKVESADPDTELEIDLEDLPRDKFHLTKVPAFA